MEDKTYQRIPLQELVIGDILVNIGTVQDIEKYLHSHIVKAIERPRGIFFKTSDYVVVLR